jgi:hypothetical protein
MGKRQQPRQQLRLVLNQMKQVHAQLRLVQALQLLLRYYNVMELKVFHKMAWLRLV